MIDAPVDTPIKRKADIPPAYYDDVEPPPPPPDDPHWREWGYSEGPEPVPRWIIYGLPALLVFAAAFHAILILVILKAGG